jgi:hypothetical protein
MVVFAVDLYERLKKDLLQIMLNKYLIIIHVAKIFSLFPSWTRREIRLKTELLLKARCQVRYCAAKDKQLQR